METGFLRILFLVAIAYGCYVFFLFSIQRQIIYPGRGIRAAAIPARPAGDITPLWIESAAGRTEAWFLPATGNSPGRRPLVLFFHGNGEIIDYLPDQVDGFRRMGMGVLLVEYPGYGRSAGAPSESAITGAAVAAYDAMAKLGDVDPARMVAFGRSLGCGVAGNLSRQRPLAALILQSPFTSTRPFARRFFLPGFLVRDVYDNRAALATYPGPILIMHGRHDDVIPFAHGKKLARVARNTTFVEMACAHNDCPPDWREFWRLLTDFLGTNGVMAPQTETMNGPPLTFSPEPR